MFPHPKDMTESKISIKNLKDARLILITSLSLFQLFNKRNSRQLWTASQFIKKLHCSYGANGSSYFRYSHLFLTYIYM